MVRSFCVLTVLGLLSTTAAMQAATIDAGSMIMRSDGLPHDGTGWGIWSPGFLGTFVETGSAGTVTVTVRACGQSAYGVNPIMVVHLGNESVSYDAGDNGSPYTTYSSYVHSFDLPAGTHAFRVAFINDFYDGVEDRNLFVKDITFTGASVTLQNVATEAMALQAADSYISNFRQGDATLALKNADGTPLPAGKRIRVKLAVPAFDWGASMYGPHWWHPQEWWMTDPNPFTHQVEYQTQAFINPRFSMLVPDYGGKLWFNEYDRDVVTMDFVDNMTTYCQTHDMDYRAHTVFWEGSRQYIEPDWWIQLKDDALAGVPGAADEYWAEMLERVDYYVADRAANYTHIDGINEATHPDPANNRAIFGWQGEFDLWNAICNAAGAAKVFVNDFQVLNDVRAGDKPDDYANWYTGYIRSLEKHGATIDGIGVQSHLYITLHDVFLDYQVLQNLATMDKPVYITEFSGGPEADVPTLMNHTIRLALGNDAVDGFVLWGFWEGGISRPETKLVDMDFRKTPVGYTYDALRATYSTDLELVTNANGEISFRGFFGEYDIHIDDAIYVMELAEGTTSYQVQVMPNDSEVVVDEPADIRAWAGTGANEAIMVIDFNDGLQPESYAWGYRWDGNANAAEMFQAIVAADHRLYGRLQSGSGLYLKGPVQIAYDLEADGAIDADDHNRTASTSPWHLSHRPDAVSPWTLSNDPIAAQTLSDGGWIGLAFGVNALPDSTIRSTPVAPTQSDTTIAAAHIVTRTSGGQVRYNPGWGLWNDGYFETFIRTDSAGTVDVNITACGQPADGVLPLMELYVDDQHASWEPADPGQPYDWYMDYATSVSLTPGLHRVRIEFNNDHYVDPSNDRNLWVNEVSFGGLPVTILNLPGLKTDADLDDDLDVDQSDFGAVQACVSGTGQAYETGCDTADLDGDGDVDTDDLLRFIDCTSGASIPANFVCR